MTILITHTLGLMYIGLLHLLVQQTDGTDSFCLAHLWR
jgi:hypothetical protein